MNIEKHIPLPTNKRRGVPAILETMEVGDSVLVETRTLANWFGAARILGFKLVMRKQDDTKHRIWRSK